MTRTCILVSVLLCTVACGKEQGGKAASPSPSAPPAAAPVATPAAPTVPAAPGAPSGLPGTVQSAAGDLSKPFLTEEKMQNLVTALAKEDNPLRDLLRPDGQVAGLGDLAAKVDEWNAFARAHGFTDYEDFLAVWTRVNLVEVTRITMTSRPSLVKMHESSIKLLEQQLAQPGLPDEVKQELTASLAQLRKDMEEAKNDKTDLSGGLNTQDLALVEKFDAKIKEANKHLRLRHTK